MPKRIRKRWLGVSFLKGVQGPAEEGIEYRLAAPPEGTIPPPSRRFVRWQTVDREHNLVRSCVAKLLDAARDGRPRGDIDLEARINSLASHVLPNAGLSVLFQDDKSAHPLFDSYPPSLADLPWESFPELFRSCDDCRTTLPTGEATDDEPGYCAKCGKQLVLHNQKIGFRRHATHLVHTAETIVPAEGNEFLIIANPTGDLFDVDTPPGKHCHDHVQEITQCVRALGYSVELLRDSFATPNAVLDYLSSPALVGLYYFGHGYLEDQSDEGCLVLHDRKPLFATEIAAIRPRCQFVFLNACHGASVGQNWGFDKPLRSVAHSFAAGGDARVVIAPIWPVASTLAATAATEFFERAAKGVRLSQALRSTRRRSYRRYAAGSPDYSWAAFRYFGDPDRFLPTPTATSREEGTVAARLFGAQQRLTTALFSFPIDEVFLRAAKRKILHGRPRVSSTDILAGLVRRGELTRFILRHLGFDPDQLYDSLEHLVEVDQSSAPATTRAVDDFDAWIVSLRSDFTEDAINCLTEADRKAQTCEAEGVITERHLLESLLDSAWDALPQLGLPSSSVARQSLSDNSVRGHIDDDGCLILTGLHPNARQIIDHAHALGQLRGTCPIPSRIMFIAFFLNDSGFANRLCETRGVDIEGLCAIFLTFTGGEGPDTFQLGDQACSRIIKPAMDAARQLADDPSSISEEDLFYGFCQAAPGEFKQLLAALPSPWKLELAELRDDDVSVSGAENVSDDPTPDNETVQSPTEIITQDAFDTDGWSTIQLAANWAQLQQSQTVRSPHLVAALIGDGSGLVGTMIKQGGIAPELGKIRLLSMVPFSAESVDTVVLSPNVGEVLVAAIKFARDRGKQRAGVQDIADAFFAGDAGAVGEQLRKLGVDTRPWWNEGYWRRHDGNGKSPSC